jgi:GT2 family glycosyltransferase
MKKVQFVFVIVVYRNTEDLEELIESIDRFDIDNEKIIVNNYYDDNSMNECYSISKRFGCSFINVENKGYGFGNNRGIEYANKHFDYEFLIVSNPDIIIKKFDKNELLKLNGTVIGPIIKTPKMKSQNPYWYLNNRVCEWMIYQGYKHKSKIMLYSGIAINKVIRELFLLIFRKSKKKYSKVFALHGSFVIFSYDVLKKIGMPYDEEMFLFAEEAHLAHMLSRNNINSYITKGVEVIHKEDGSMTISNINEKTELRKSVLTYYTKWHKNI